MSNQSLVCKHNLLRRSCGYCEAEDIEAEYEVELQRLGELLECDPDIGSLCAAVIHRNRERDRMLRTIAELRGTCGTDIVELRGSRGTDGD